MIVVTQGHEKGIGLEVFFNALALAPSEWATRCVLVACKKTVQAHLKKLGIPFQIAGDTLQLRQLEITCQWVKEDSKWTQSTLCLESGLEYVGTDRQHLLFTLPTTKEDIKNVRAAKKKFLGHTEFLRARFKNDSLGMFFSAPKLNVLLLTDHLALKDVPTALTPTLFRQRLETSLNALRDLEKGIDRVLVAGLNPHAGEGGLLGKEEGRLAVALKKVRVSGISIKGFYPADSLMNEWQDSQDLLVYPHHDQGLSAFKSLMGTLGANITLGLPFVRLSVDHGTAFSLYGKNLADPRGALYCLRKAVAYQEQTFGKNHRQQS
jgi:4-hydroxy-L-threonine phosphate dehydrogenase PdxA